VICWGLPASQFVVSSTGEVYDGRVRNKIGKTAQQRKDDTVKASASEDSKPVTRKELIDLLNGDLAREYQAIISYVVYSQVLKGAAYMNIAGELEKHAAEELAHALVISNQIDYLGGMPTVNSAHVRTSEKAEDMLHFDLESEQETIHNYRVRVGQCEQLGEYAMAEHIRDILIDEQDHLIALATALGIDPPSLKN
jgi:bacterioferritin